ncbi:MAG: glycosyltransferase [Proteobacteria bacterium]|nr:glycosyltransferase [Pseudomonadota bacterium]
MTSAPSDSGKPRLLVVTSMFPRWADDTEPGFVFELCRRLAARFEVRVLAPHAPGAALRETLDGVEVIRYRYAPRRLQTLAYGGGIVPKLRRQPWKWLLVPVFLVGQYRAIRRELRRWRPQVVHAHWIIPQGVLAALAVGKRPRPAFVATAHGTDLFAFNGNLMRRLKRLVLDRCAGATVVSGAMRDAAIALGADAGKIGVAPMGVDLRDRFTVDDRIVRSRNQILFVGRLAPSKGLNILLDAMPQILSAQPEATLTLAGFGPEEDALRAQAQRLNIDPRVTFAGPLPQSALPDWYRRAAVFVAPYVRTQAGEQEGFGLTIVEAIGCGCPVVATDMPGSRDILGEDADLIEPGNAQALAAAVVKVLAGNDAAAAHRARWRERVAEKFDWRQVADQYGNLLAAAAGRRSRE